MAREAHQDAQDARQGPVKPRRLYLAGPMTNLPDFNYPVFHAAAARLRAAGYEVCNPAENFGGDQTLPYETYIEAALEQIETCDALALLPGWWQSSGVRTELEYAIRLSKAFAPVEEYLAIDSVAEYHAPVWRELIPFAHALDELAALSQPPAGDARGSGAAEEGA
jgi:nucleoside 2-deoxyribosyltransferase